MPDTLSSNVIDVIELTRAPSVIIAHPKTNMRTVKELIAAAKAAPGKLVYGSAGNGSPTNIAMELFKSAAGVDMIVRARQRTLIQRTPCDQSTRLASYDNRHCRAVPGIYLSPRP